MGLPSSSIKVIKLQQPKMRKGSFASLIGANPLVDAFIVGPENQAVSESVSPEGIEQLLERSPLYLYGPPGCGKTAIALTIAARWSNEVADRTVTITSGSDFAKAFTRAIEADDMDRFRQLHRQCKCLLIDNIHELATKPAAQDEMVSTIEQLLGDGRAIIATAPELASLTPNFCVALTSRLNGGHSLPIKHPSPESCREILRLLCVQSQLDISDEDLLAIGEQLQTGITALQLRGILIRWAHQERLDPHRTRKESKRLIDHLVDQQQPALNIADIAKAVAREMQVTLDLLRGPSRKSSIVRARGLAMHLMRQWTNESYQSIGEFFGGRDHTTVMHACKKIEEEFQSDVELSRVSDRIKQKLNVIGNDATAKASSR